MALYRQIQTSFWEDEKVVDEFTPEDRYFMLYLMTNPHSNLLGCYSITLRQIEFETGYNRDTVIKLLNRFENILNIIQYDRETKELFIFNWHKYNWTTSPKTLSGIQKDASEIKSDTLRQKINYILIGYGYGIEGVSPAIAIALAKEKAIEKEQEIEKEEKSKIDVSVNPYKQKFLDCFKEAFGNYPRLTWEESKKIVELARDNQDFLEIIPNVVSKIRSIEWDIGFQPNANWLLKDNNFYRVLNGEFDGAKASKCAADYLVFDEELANG